MWWGGALYVCVLVGCVSSQNLDAHSHIPALDWICRTLKATHRFGQLIKKVIMTSGSFTEPTSQSHLLAFADSSETRPRPKVGPSFQGFIFKMHPDWQAVTSVALETPLHNPKSVNTKPHTYTHTSRICKQLRQYFFLIKMPTRRMQAGRMLGLLIFLTTKQAFPFAISTNNISGSKTAKAHDARVLA